MTVSTHIPTKLMLAQGKQTSGQAVNFNADAFKIMAVVAGSGRPSCTSSGIQFVADVTATNAEDTNIGARQSLAGVSFAFDGGGTACDWSFSTITYAQSGSDDGLTRYFIVYDNTTTPGVDATSPVVALIDPGQLVSVVNGSLTIQSPTGGLIQFTGGG